MRAAASQRAASAAALAAAHVCGGGGPAAAQTASFGYTGAVQSYTVPAGMGSITLQLAGGGGGGGGADENGAGAGGGNGAAATGTYLVAPGSVLQIYVGGGGKQGFTSNFGQTCTNSAGAGGSAGGDAEANYYKQCCQLQFSIAIRRSGADLGDPLESDRRHQDPRCLS